MPTTIKESFRKYSENLNITDRQETIVSTCRKNVVSTIGEKLSLHPNQPSKLIGSYDRNTLTRYLTEGDVDVMVVLNYDVHKDWDNKEGVEKVLKKIRSILQDAYPKTVCHVDRNCVTMELSEFKLDVVPAFRYKEGYYTIPDTYREKWLETDPVAFAGEVTRINKNMDGAFIPLIKMIKGWNRELTKPLRGFHLECIMVKHYTAYETSYTFDSMIRAFFSKLPAYLDAPAYDPTRGDRVDLYLDNDSLGYSRQALVNKAKKASEAAEEAYNDEEQYPTVAIEEWKGLLGEFFPAYG